MKMSNIAKIEELEGPLLLSDNDKWHGFYAYHESQRPCRN